MPLFAHFLGMRFKTFDEAIAGIEAAISDIHAEVKRLCRNGAASRPVGLPFPAASSSRMPSPRVWRAIAVAARRAGCHVGITFKRKVWKQPFGGAEASRDRLGLASQAGSLSLALDAADTIQAQDSLEKMLVHQMAVLHCGMMRATARMNKELDAAGGTAIDAAGDKRDLTAGEREAANVRACRLAGAISRMSATFQQGLITLQRKRTGGNQQVTVKHIHQQVNVTQGGQAVVAGNKVMSRTRGTAGERRRGVIANER